ncbi:MAG TPA: amino acid permease [Mariprofundaceae bacterium]|nr:amino acid permease [Mariprofundaceae bacterium]
MVRKLFRRRHLSHGEGQESLHRALGVLDLTLLGIGAVIGAGIFVLTGVAAATQAGPGLFLSFIVAGAACALTALIYAELSSSIPFAGSAYTYTYASLGELPAWLIGWVLILEYGVASAAVSIGWSGYLGNLFGSTGFYLPAELTHAPGDGGVMNLPAALIILAVSTVLALGIRQGSRLNSGIVAIKLSVLALFIIVAVGHVNPANWHPFLPFGWSGVMAGAAYIFFAYIGFDAVSTAAEEAKNPQRDVPRGILYSLGVCTILYMVVSLLLTGVLSYTRLNVPDPVAFAMTSVGAVNVARLISIGAIAGLTSVLLVLLYGQSRIFFSMSRDGMLPELFSRVHPRFRSPVVVTLATGIIIACVAAFTPIQRVAELVNMGTLSAFTLVALGALVMRRTHPDLQRPFRAPFMPWTSVLAMAFCLFLIAHLSRVTFVGFGIWTVIGLVIYFAYSRHRSVMAKAE